MSGYSDGRRVEWAVRDELTDNGYEVMRGSSSKGFADICAVKQNQALVISCKRTTMPGPDERARLLRTASLLGDIGVPLVALKPLGHGRPTYRRLTGPGPKDWVPWTADEVTP